MLERYEFRLFEKYADLLGVALPSDTKSAYGIVILRGVVDDELFTRIRQLHQDAQRAGAGHIFSHSEITRTYTQQEFDEAEFFLPKILFTHLAGEEFGTRYNESPDCEQEAFEILYPDSDYSNPVVVTTKVPCGICSTQATLLRLPFGRLARSRPIQRLWGGELVISEQLAQVIGAERLTVGALYPIRNMRSSPVAPLVLANSAGSELFALSQKLGLNPERLDFWKWLHNDAPKDLSSVFLSEQTQVQINGTNLSAFSQLLPGSHPLEVSGENRFGDDLFDTSAGGSFHCKSGVLAGNKLLSPLSILRSSWDGSDICKTRIFVGARQGLFRPHPLFVVSRQFAEKMKRAKIKGLSYEIVHAR